MAIPTVEQAAARAAFHLGDMKQKRYNSAELQIAVAAAWEEMVAHMLLCGVKAIRLKALYTLPANTSELLPETAGILNYGEMIRFGERPSGSSELYTRIDLKDELPQTQGQGSKLYWYEWSGEKFFFNPVAGAIQLKFEYYASGRAPDSGSLLIDDCMNVVAKLAAAIAAPTKGEFNLAVMLRNEVYGDRDPNSPQHMHNLIQPMLRAMQSDSPQYPAYGESGKPAGGFGRYPQILA